MTLLNLWVPCHCFSREKYSYVSRLPAGRGKGLEHWSLERRDRWESFMDPGGKRRRSQLWLKLWSSEQGSTSTAAPVMQGSYRTIAQLLLPHRPSRALLNRKSFPYFCTSTLEQLDMLFSSFLPWCQAWARSYLSYLSYLPEIINPHNSPMKLRWLSHFLRD